MSNLRHTEKTVYGLFNDSFPPVIDGVTLTVENYCRYLHEADRRVCVVTPWNPVVPPHDTFEIHRYFSLPIYNRHPYRYGYPMLDPLIWRDLRHTPFRLVHAHCPFSSGRLAVYAARHHNVPLIATFHSKYRTDLEHSLPGWMVKIQMRRILDFYNSATQVWIPQGAVEETLREYGYRGPVRVVENGNDLADGIDDLRVYRAEARQASGYSPDRINLLFVGQHILEKGIEIIVRALDILAKSGTDFRMDFIGEGYARDDMMALASQLGLESGKVNFHGMIDDRERLRRFYAAADLFLFPSYYDNAPLVVREAAAMLTPSLLPSGSTAAELVTHGRNGFLTERTPESYAQAISALAADRDALAAAGRGARETLCRPWSDVMQEVMGLYDEIISRHERDSRRNR